MPTIKGGLSEEQTKEMFDLISKIGSSIEEEEKETPGKPSPKPNESNVSSGPQKAPKSQFFSLRILLVSFLLQSQMTVREKLDILYDIAEINSEYSDGIQIEEVTALFAQVLTNHQQLIPYNELQLNVEKAFSRGRVNGLIAAYWTNLPSCQIQG